MEKHLAIITVVDCNVGFYFYMYVHRYVDNVACTVFDTEGVNN